MAQRSLYEKLKDEWFIHQDIYTVSPELAKKAKKAALKQLREEGVDIEEEELMLIPDVYWNYYDLIEAEVPDWIVGYVDIFAMIRDEIFSGYLINMVVEVNSSNVWVFYR